MINKVEIYGVDLRNYSPICRNFKDEESFTEWLKTNGKNTVVHPMKIDEYFKVIPLGLSDLKRWCIYEILTNPGIRARLPRLTKLAYELHPEKF